MVVVLRTVGNRRYGTWFSDKTAMVMLLYSLWGRGFGYGFQIGSAASLVAGRCKCRFNACQR